MRLVLVAVARFALIAVPSSVVFSITGCATSSFGGAAPGYDQQACVERALRRAPEAGTVAAARRAFEIECHEGGAEACSALGVMNEIGVGLPANAERAFALYARACDAGNSRGCANLGVAMVEGIGGPRDVARGARFLEQSCDRNDARACLHLARLRDGGDAAWHDAALASHLFELACNGDEAPACVALGDIRAREGTSDAVGELYGKACSLGDASGCNRVEAPRKDARVEVAASDGR